MSKLLIFGNEQMAEIAHYYFSTDSEYEIVAFVVDKEYIRDKSFKGLPVYAFEEATNLFPKNEYRYFVALGYSKMNRVRELIFNRIKDAGYSFASYISSRCDWLSESAPGENCFILENNTIQPFSKIGDNVTMWSGNHLGHHSTVQDHCFVSSHVVISGNVTIGNNSFLGVNATIADGLVIAPFTLLGAGVIMTKNSIEHGAYVPEKAILLNKTSDYFI